MIADKQKGPVQDLSKNETVDGTVRRSTGSAVRPYQPRRQRKSIKVDRVDPRDLARFDARFFCDDCSHYDSTGGICTMGYVPQHTRKEQMALFNLSGMMAFCRFLEID